MTRLEDLPDLLTVTETAKWARCDRNTMYAAVRAGTVPSIRLSARVIRIPRHALAALLAGAGPPGDEKGPNGDEPSGPSTLDRATDERPAHG